MGLFARADVVPIDPTELKDVVTDLRVGQNFQVAIVSLLVYDTIITFDKEVKYFWKVPRRPVDVIFFMNRYIGIFSVVARLFIGSFTATLPLCNFSQWTINIANWMVIVWIDYILMIRVLALYSQEKRLSICLNTLLAMESVFKLGMIVYLETKTHLVVSIYADISICAASTVPPWQLVMSDWFVPLAYETLLMILALYKAAEYWRMSAGFRGFALVKVLIEDQILYFSLVISCSVFSMLDIRLVLSNTFLSTVFDELGNPAVLALLGSRMLLNMKEVAERGQNEGTSYRTPSRTLSSIDFAEPVNPQRESGAETSGSEETA